MPRLRKGRPERPAGDTVRRTIMLPADVPTADTWQVARVQLDVEVEDRRGATRRPWLTIVVGAETELSLGTDMRLKRPAASDVMKVIRQVMEKPTIGRPHRPKRVVCSDPDLAESLTAGLATLGVECQAGETPQLAELVADLGQFLEARENVRGLLETSGATPEAVGRLFEAAAAFYDSAPWELVEGDLPISVRVPRVRDQVSYIVVMGQAGIQRGLAVFRTAESLEIGLSDLEPEEMMALADQEALTYGELETSWSHPIWRPSSSTTGGSPPTTRILCRTSRPRRARSDVRAPRIWHGTRPSCGRCPSS